MSHSTFINDAITSAKNYYDYVDIHNRARAIIYAYNITRIKKNIFSLELSKSINNDGDVRMCLQTATPDTSIFCDTEKRYVKGELFSVAEANSNGTITLNVSDELDCILQETNCRDISFVSDMKFLIENVKKWYVEYGNRISPPPPPTINSREYFFTLNESPHQTDAINNALSSNISYVWGPPGTGKTQIVLSDCVLSYVKKRESVLIIAPTNNAVENTLRAIIASMQNKDENIDCLYRMGMSSNDFAQEYGEICETRDATAVIKKLQQDMTVLQEKRRQELVAVQTMAEYDKFKLSKNNYDEAEKTKKEYLQMQQAFQYDLLQDEIQLKSYRKTLNDIIQQQTKLERKEKTIAFQIKQFFNKDTTILHSIKKKELNERYSSCIDKISEIENHVTSLKHSINNCDDIIKKVNCSSETAMRIAQEVATNTIGYFTDFEDISEKFEQKYADAKDVHIDENTENEIVALGAHIKAIEEQTTKDIEKKYVYAFTADYLISHYQTLYDLGICSKISHVFLDEAAYCPFIKTAPLFSFNVPVTFFGDHMQLPPICEASDNALSSRDEKLFLWDMSALYFPQLFETDYSLEDIFTTYENKTPPQSTVMSISVLSKTFRFGDNLAKILDKFVYNTGFCGQTAFDTTITAIHAKKLGNETQKRVNLGEVKAIKEYILNNSLDDFAILTPYVNQMKELSKHLQDIVNCENISTIHASQGKEWDTVIISVSDTDKMHFTNSLTTDGLFTMNTAISRAKRNIVLVCDCDFWSKHGERQLIGKLVNNATQKINFLPYK